MEWSSAVLRNVGDILVGAPAVRPLHQRPSHTPYVVDTAWSQRRPVVSTGSLVAACCNVFVLTAVVGGLV
jgi:hypothetical protein